MPAHPTRRTILVGAASAGVVGAPLAAQAMAPDPIFTAIEAHRRTFKAFGALADQWDALTEIVPRERRQTSMRDEYVTASDDPRWIAFCHSSRAVRERDLAAEKALVDIVPTTMAGVAALLEYSAEYALAGCDWAGEYIVGDRDADWETLCAQNCAKALRALAA